MGNQIRRGEKGYNRPEIELNGQVSQDQVVSVSFGVAGDEDQQDSQLFGTFT
jgi:hypothetical protein